MKLALLLVLKTLSTNQQHWNSNHSSLILINNRKISSIWNRQRLIFLPKLKLNRKNIKHLISTTYLITDTSTPTIRLIQILTHLNNKNSNNLNLGLQKVTICSTMLLQMWWFFKNLFSQKYYLIHSLLRTLFALRNSPVVRYTSYNNKRQFKTITIMRINDI